MKKFFRVTSFKVGDDKKVFTVKTMDEDDDKNFIQSFPKRKSAEGLARRLNDYFNRFLEEKKNP